MSVLALRRALRQSENLRGCAIEQPEQEDCERGGLRMTGYSALGAPAPLELTESFDPSGSVTNAPLALYDPSRAR